MTKENSLLEEIVALAKEEVLSFNLLKFMAASMDFLIMGRLELSFEKISRMRGGKTWLEGVMIW